MPQPYRNSSGPQAFRGGFTTKSNPHELTNSFTLHDDALGAEQSPFEGNVSSVPAQLSTGGDDAVARDSWLVALAHDVADCSPGTRLTRAGSDVSVSGDASGRNAADDGQDAGSEAGSEGR